MNPDPTPQPNALASVPLRIISRDWLLTNRLPFDGAHRPSNNPEIPWIRSNYGGEIVPDKYLDYRTYATAADLPPEAFTQPADAATAQESMDVPNAGQSYDVHLKALQEENKRLKIQVEAFKETVVRYNAEAEHFGWKHGRFGPLGSYCWRRTDGLISDFPVFIPLAKINGFLAERDTAEKKARELGAVLQAAKVYAGHIAGILKHKRESDDSTIHAGNTSFKSMEQWALSILALPPTPSQEQAGGATLNDSSSLEAPVPDTHRAALNAPGQATRDRQVSNQPSGLCEQSLPADSPVETLATSDRERSASPAVPPGEGAALLPFELAKALAGAQVVTRDGRDWKILGVEIDGKLVQVIGAIDGNRDAWNIDGRYWVKPDHRDLFLAPAPGTGADTEGEG